MPKYTYKMFVLSQIKEVAKARQEARDRRDSEIAAYAGSLEKNKPNLFASKLYADYEQKYTEIGADYLNSLGAEGWKVIAYDRDLFVMEHVE